MSTTTITEVTKIKYGQVTGMNEGPIVTVIFFTKCVP